MTIGGIGGNANAGSGAVRMENPNMDAYSKSLQKQIMEAQKQLQELGQNDEMDPDTKMKKRQEIQKQISDLNMQLRQHQMEERKKAQQEKRQKNQPQKSEENESGLSKNSMEAMISADNSLKQAKVQGDTAKWLQNSADIKRSEIKRDGGGSKRSPDDNALISSKWDDVESMEQHAKAATASQMSTLAEAQNKLSEANAKDSASAKTQEKNDEKAKAEGQETEAVSGTEAATATEAVSTVVNAEEPETETSAPMSVTAKESAAIGSNIDVRV